MRLLNRATWIAIAVVGWIAVSSTGHAQAPQRIAPDVYGNLHWRFIGPEGNRFSTAAGIPGDPSTYYVGAASGGIWKTTDGGDTFEPIFDDQPAQAIGALAVAPSSPNIVWAGTGEAWAIRDADIMGDGVYKSMDAGKTWSHAGLPETGRIARILVHPTNPDIVLVCALGRATGPQQERGVFRTTDGGRTWNQTLFVNADRKSVV